MKKRTLYLNEFTPMHWYWVACGLAKQLTFEIKAVHELEGKMPEEAIECFADMCDEIADALLIAIHEHDAMVKRRDPYSDVEPLRYNPEISRALEDYTALKEQER